MGVMGVQPPPPFLVPFFVFVFYFADLMIYIGNYSGVVGVCLICIRRILKRYLHRILKNIGHFGVYARALKIDYDTKKTNKM